MIISTAKPEKTGKQKERKIKKDGKIHEHIKRERFKI